MDVARIATGKDPGPSRRISPGSSQQRPARRERDRIRLEPPLELMERYSFGEILGRGAFGQVHAVQERSSGRDLAIKLIPLHGDGSQAEKEILSQLSFEHPSLLRCFGAGAHGDVAYLVMERAEGTLEDLFVEGEELGRCWWALGRVAQALDWLHQQGVIHRDVKPANIMLTPEGAKLGDLGVAAGLSRQTPGGTPIGSPAYMAPEQARGEVLDGRADIYSLGVVYHRLLTGRFPYPENDSLGMLFAVARGMVTPDQEVLERLPERAAELLLAALSPDPDERPESLAELVQIALPASFGRRRRVLNPEEESSQVTGIRPPIERHLESGSLLEVSEPSALLPIFLVTVVLACCALVMLVPG